MSSDSARDAVIVDAVRTPFGKEDGLLRNVHPQVLGAKPLEALRERNGFDPADDIEDVHYGCVTPKGEQGYNIGRLVSLVAGWDVDVPGVQLNRQCGSGQQAVNFGAANIRSGFHDCVIAGGVEHMTREPMGSDGDFGTMSEPYTDRFEVVPQGESAERIADEWGFEREEVDELAYDSQKRMKEAMEDGRYDDQLVPVETEVDGEEVVVNEDEHPRPDTTLEKMGKLPLVFRGGDNGVITPGNSSGIVDGSSALLMASEEKAREEGWEPKARIVDVAVAGVDPVMMLTGPIPATERVLDSAGMSIEDIDLFECNEAFASVVLAWLQETGAPWDRTNVNGGAIAHGHPLGATGSALVTKLVHELERRDERYGLSTMCIGFGQGIATIIERID
ncbi:MAG: thiolase family protein [Halobacteria archaeon]|nr:thiolase family protein [Halobacteria archaeon]